MILISTLLVTLFNFNDNQVSENKEIEFNNKIIEKVNNCPGVNLWATSGNPRMAYNCLFDCNVSNSSGNDVYVFIQWEQQCYDSSTGITQLCFSSPIMPSPQQFKVEKNTTEDYSFQQNVPNWAGLIKLTIYVCSSSSFSTNNICTQVVRYGKHCAT